MTKLNILQVYDFMKLGGAETHIITLSKALNNRGHNTIVLSSYGPAVEMLKKNLIKHIEMDIPNNNKLHENCQKLLKIIQEYKIDIIHVHPFQSQVVGAHLKKLTDIPLVTTIHGNYLTPSIGNFKKRFDYHIFISKESYNFCLKNGNFKSRNYSIIPNCVEIKETFDKFEIVNRKLKIKYISRLDLDKLKSVLFFIECIDALSSKIDIEVSIIGSGKSFSYVFDKVKTVNDKYKKRIIKLINGSTVIDEHIQKADVVVGVGRVILEALSHGKIPICVGNNNYVGIVDKEKFIHISNVNFTDRNISKKLDKNLFIDEILWILSNPQAIKEKLQKTYEFFFNNYNISKSALEHEKVYFDIIKKYELLQR